MSDRSERLTLHAYRTGWRVVRRVPARVAYAGARAGADVLWRRQGRPVQKLEANLARLLDLEATDPRLRSLSRRAMRSYARYWIDAFRLPDWTPDEVRARTRLIDAHHLYEAMEQGKGVVVPLPHMANWDLAGAWASLDVAPVMTVAERLKPAELFEEFLAYRERLGMKILPLTGAATPIMQTMSGYLRDGGLVCLVGDRDLSRRGMPVTIAGHATKMPAGAATLALRTGAALVPVTLSYEGREPRHRLVIRFHPRITTKRIAHATQQVADAFTEGLREHPEDWHMLQRYFLADLPAGDTRREGVQL